MADESTPEPGDEREQQDSSESSPDHSSESPVDRSAEDESEARKPISVRDLMPPPSAGGRRPAQDRGEEGTASEGEVLPPKPTPVRVAMDTPPPGDSRPAEALPSRRFEAEGEEWVVRVTGRTITGSRPDPGALLMQLGFYRGSAPDHPARELLTVARPLEALYEEDLREFLQRSRPARNPFGEDSEGA